MTSWVCVHLDECRCSHNCGIHLGAQAGLKSRQPDPKDDENAQLKALVGDLTLRQEIHRQAENSGQVSSIPTVDTKFPRAQKCCLVKFRFASSFQCRRTRCQAPGIA